MFPPIYELAVASQAVRSLLGANPRVYPFGEAPQAVQYPYVVWRSVGGNPENYVNQSPDIDHFVAAVDCHAMSADSVRAVCKALVEALQDRGMVTSWTGELRNADTREYVTGFVVEFFVER